MPLSKAKQTILIGPPRFNGNPYSDYTLLDLFTTPLAAGAVNGTPVDGVGGVRTVAADSGSKLSISGGALVSAAAIGDTDPVIRWAAITRLLGITLLIDLTSLVQTVSLGFSNNATVSNTTGEPYFRMSTSVTNVRLTSGSVLPVSAVIPTKLAITLRTAGGFLFGKHGGFWTLDYVYGTGSTATLYPALDNANAASALTIDNIRVPKRLFIPVPLQSDGFSAATADGAGNAEANGPVGSVWTGATWAVAAGAVTNTPTPGSDVVVNGTFAADTDWTKGAGWAIAAGVAGAVAASADLTAAVAPLTLGGWYRIVYDLSGFGAGTVAAVIGTTVNPTHAANATYGETNRATSTALAMRGVGFTGSIDNVIVKPLTLSELIRSISASSANVVAEVAITRTAGFQSGIVINLDSAGTPANFVLAYLDGNGNCKLDKCVAGVYTNVISAAITYLAGAVLSLHKDGTSYRLFYNNLAVGTVQTISDAGITNNTLHGLFSTGVDNSFDNFVVWPKGNSENAYPQLDMM